jgi:hypothetical protein
MTPRALNVLGGSDGGGAESVIPADRVHALVTHGDTDDARRVLVPSEGRADTVFPENDLALVIA